eukprot:6174044-Pleurochrysis_carterae.AAC.1
MAPSAISLKSRGFLLLCVSVAQLAGVAAHKAHHTLFNSFFVQLSVDVRITVYLCKNTSSRCTAEQPRYYKESPDINRSKIMSQI